MLNATANFFTKTGLTWFVPFVRLAQGDDPQEQIKSILMMIGIPIVAMIVFLSIWQVAA